MHTGTKVNLTLEETDIVMGENERREICVVSLQAYFSHPIPITITYQSDTAMGMLLLLPQFSREGANFIVISGV